MQENNLRNIFEQFSKLKVLVLGDVMIDAYLWGNVSRISPEAPVPIVDITARENRLGGAANVALNLLSLGATPYICSVIGKDDKGKTFEELLAKRALPSEGLLAVDDRKTTVKTRIISNNQQMLRVDDENKQDLNEELEDAFISHVSKLIDTNSFDVIIFEDYNKGVLTDKVIRSIIDIALDKGIPTTVDPKKKNFFSYQNVTLFKPNLKELREGLNLSVDPTRLASLQDAELALRKKLNNQLSLITLSENGVFISDSTNSKIKPAHIRNISDVSGAGDTVISVASLALALKLDIELLAELANLAGGLVCENVGVVSVNKEQLLQEALLLIK